MHNKHAKDGLAVVSVNLDDPKNKETREAVSRFLSEKKATFTNLVLDAKEKPDAWFDKLKVDAIPQAFVYGRDGKLAKQFEGSGLHEEIEECVVELLKKK